MQVQLTEEQVVALKQLGEREKLSIAELVRQAVDALVAGRRRDSMAERRRRAIAVAGRFGSGRRDVSGAHDAHLAEAFRR